MTWLYARYLAIRGAGWFMPSAAGGWPVPAQWQGWTALGVFVGAILATMWLPGELALIARVGSAIGYIALSVIACG